MADSHLPLAIRHLPLFDQLLQDRAVQFFFAEPAKHGLRQ